MCVSLGSSHPLGDQLDQATDLPRRRLHTWRRATSSGARPSISSSLDPTPEAEAKELQTEGWIKSQLFGDIKMDKLTASMNRRVGNVSLS